MDDIQLDLDLPAPAPKAKARHGLKDLTREDNPLYKLEERPDERLSNSELLAVLLDGARVDNPLQKALEVLQQYGGLRAVARLNAQEWGRIEGVGPARALALVATFKLAQRVYAEPELERAQIKQPADAFMLCREMQVLEREEMRVLLLNQKNRVVGQQTVYQGSLHTTVVRVSELFQRAVRENCAALIVLHNHPSGDPTPSPEDAALTREIVKAGELLDIQVLDHLVVGSPERGFVSMKERGLGFNG